jgi:hypothetical protein
MFKTDRLILLQHLQEAHGVENNMFLLFGLGISGDK